MSPASAAGTGRTIATVVRWGWYSIAVNVALIAPHALISTVSGSLAVTAELTHNFVDLAAAGVVAAGLKLAMHRAPVFPYGLYKVENLVAAGLAVMIFLTAYKIVQTVLFGTAQDLRVDAWMLVALAATMAIPLAFSHYEMRVARAAGSPALMADAREYRVPAYTTGIAFAALLSAWLDIPLDRMAALIIVAAVAKTGWDLLVDSLRVLLDASLDSKALAEIARVIAADPAVAELKWVTGRNAGRFRFVEAGVAIRLRDLAVAESAMRRIENGVRAAMPQIERALLHAEARTATCERYAVPLSDSIWTISAHFGEAPYFAFVDIRRADGAVEEQRVRANPHVAVSQAKGIRVAEWIAGEKADRVFVPHAFDGKGPAYVFRDAGIDVVVTERRSVAELLAHQAARDARA